MKQSYLFLFFLVFFNYNSLDAQEYVPFSTRLPQGNLEVKGDLVLVGNNIVNRQTNQKALLMKKVSLFQMKFSKN